MDSRKNYRVLIFDWDGTLADSVGQIVTAITLAAEANGLTITSPDAVKDVIGLSLDQAMSTILPNQDKALQAALIRDYKRFYLNPEVNAKLFPAATKWLPIFKQHYWLAVATGKGRIGLEKSLAETNSANFFMCTKTVDECPSKPNPQMILDICDELGVTPNDVLVIGDTTHDLLMAKNAGADAIAVATGANDDTTLKTIPSLAVLSDLNELAQWLQLD